MFCIIQFLKLPNKDYYYYIITSLVTNIFCMLFEWCLRNACVVSEWVKSKWVSWWGMGLHVRSVLESNDWVRLNEEQVRNEFEWWVFETLDGVFSIINCKCACLNEGWLHVCMSEESTEQLEECKCSFEGDSQIII